MFLRANVLLLSIVATPSHAATPATTTTWSLFVLVLLIAAVFALMVRSQILASQLKRLGSQLQNKEQQLHLLADNMTDIIWRLDSNNRIIYVSPSVKKVLGYHPEELVGRLVSQVLQPESTEFAYNLQSKLVQAAKKGDYQGQTDTTTEMVQRHKSGQAIWTEVILRVFFTPSGDFDGAQGITRDISARKEAEEAFRHLAFNDPLTQLPNRRLLGDRLAQALINCTRHKETCGIFFLDLDNFKYINDTHGHGGGDALLQQVAHRLRHQLRESDTIARFGGDEFVIISQFLGESRDAARKHAQYIGEKIIELFEQPFVVNDQSYPIHTSVGVALCEGNKSNADELLRQADMAMYQAKVQGHNRIVIAA